MAYLKYILPALAVAGSAAAQGSACSTTTTIQNAGDAMALSTCTTFSGDIAIATGTTDNIALDGIQKIEGSLIADNVTQITQISANDLEQITDQFSLNGLTILSTLNFPQLSQVGDIEWIALPALQGLTFQNGVQNATTVSIQNTKLNSLEGINLQTIDKLFIANNNFLDEISMQLGEVTTSVIIQANGNNVTAEFPNLIWAYNMTFDNIQSLSIPSLAMINGSLGFYENAMSTLSAPNLTNVNGTLSFVDNNQLTNVSMPQLVSVLGGLSIANNTEYDDIEFDSLQNVGGAIDFHGNFTNVTLPGLKQVHGAMNLQSSGDISQVCDHFEPLHASNGVIQGSFTCAGSQSNPGGLGSTPTGSGVSSSSTNTGAASGFYAQSAGVTGVIGVIAAIFGML